MEKENLISVNLLVKPHIAKFINHYSDKIIISSLSSHKLIANVIRMFLTSKENFYKYNVKNDSPKLAGFVEVDVYVSFRLFQEIRGCMIMDSEHIIINSLLDQIFREKLFSYVIAARTYTTKPYNDLIIDFLDLYDISIDEIDYETLKRYIYRKGILNN